MTSLRDADRLRKDLGLLDIYAISTGAMFSSGFFLLPGLAFGMTGPSVALAYLASALFILPAMLSMAELATAMPRAGGAYYFLDRSLGPLAGTVGGLGTWMALILKTAFALVGLGAYLAIYVDVPIQPLALALTALFATLNVVGAKETSGLQKILVAALLVILGLFVVLGMAGTGIRALGPPSTETAGPFFSAGFGGFMATVGFVFVSYAGLTQVASVSEEVRNPDRNIPLGMMLSLATVAAVYSLGVLIIVALVPPASLVEDLTPVASAADVVFSWLPQGTGLALIVVAAAAAFASTGNAGILAASRYPLAMARDLLVSPGLGRLGRFRTPTRSIVLTSLLIVLAILLLDVEGIAKLASAFQLLLFSLINLAVIIMRESRIAGYDPGYRSPLYPWMQLVGFLSSFWLIAQMGEMAMLFTLGLVAATVGWYLHYGSRRVRRAGAIFHTFARLGERRHGGLDRELREIVREKGLRDEDPFEELVARAPVLEAPPEISFPELVRICAASLERAAGIRKEILEDGFSREMASGFVPLGSGVALPHLRIAGLSRPAMLLVRSATGFAIADRPQGQDDQGTQTVQALVFLLSPHEEPGQHLRLLGHLATRIDDPGFLPAWLSAGSEAELRATLLRDENSLTVRLSEAPTARGWIGSPLRVIGLPRGTLVAVVRRGGRTIVPDGSSILEAGDHLTIIGDRNGIRSLAGRLGMEGRHPGKGRPPEAA